MLFFLGILVFRKRETFSDFVSRRDRMFLLLPIQALTLLLDDFYRAWSVFVRPIRC